MPLSKATKHIYKPGDKVRVKTEAQMLREFGSLYAVPFTFATDMIEFCGRICTIAKTYRTYDDEPGYKLAETNGLFSFSEEMLLPSEPTKNKYGCVVIGGTDEI